MRRLYTTVACRAGAGLLLAYILPTGCAAPLDLQVGNVGRLPGAGLHATVGAMRRGEPVSLSASSASVTVDTRGTGDWASASDVVVDWTAPPLIDVVLVADNSGSEADYLDDITDALGGFAHSLLARNPDDRVGLVRVSTEASVVLDPTSEQAAIDDAIAGLYVNEGWTALWDGVRQANEVIADTTFSADGASLCYSGAYPTVVAFTDGEDNNSADEHATAYDGDGVDTTLDDLLDLDVGGLSTVVHTVGVGDGVDDASLATLAAETGGEYESIASYMGLVGTLHRIATQLSTQVPVCFTPADCSDTEARVTLTWRERGVLTTAEVTASIPESCE